MVTDPTPQPAPTPGPVPPSGEASLPIGRLTGAVSEDSLVDRLGGDADPKPRRELPPRYTGLVIFIIVASLTLVFFTGFVVLAVVTYPSADTVARLVGNGSLDETLRTEAALRSEWISEVTTAGQLLVFGSMVPLLGTIVGYVLGSRQADQTR